MKTYENSANRKANRQLLKFADVTSQNKISGPGPLKCNLKVRIPFPVNPLELKFKALSNGTFLPENNQSKISFLKKRLTLRRSNFSLYMTVDPQFNPDPDPDFKVIPDPDID
jgi:hypothetical protein